MVRGHLTSIIHTSCHKQIKSLEFHIGAKFANPVLIFFVSWSLLQKWNLLINVTLFNGSYKEFLFQRLFFMLEGHVTFN